MWKYDGEKIEQVVNNVFGGTMPNTGVDFDYVTVFDDKIFFAASDGTVPDASVGLTTQLWMWDGVGNATVVQATFPFAPKYLTPYQGRLYFSAQGDRTGQELWVCTPDDWVKPEVENTDSAADAAMMGGIETDSEMGMEGDDSTMMDASGIIEKLGACGNAATGEIDMGCLQGVLSTLDPAIIGKLAQCAGTSSIADMQTCVEEELGAGDMPERPMPEDGIAPLPENDQDLMDLLDNLPEDDKDVYDDLIEDLLENKDDLPDSMHDFIEKHIDPRAFDSPASVEHLNLPLAVVTVAWFILASLLM